jgi:hypothetical protein
MHFCRQYLLSFLAIFFFLILTGCDNSSTPLVAARKTLPTTIISGFQIPVFSSPDEQLNYTQSWFDSQDEKKASLLAVARLFPDATGQRAAAALDLSYQLLGQDYRLAASEICLEAIKNYREIIEEFQDLPEICAKAYWYMGWIFCDLLKDKKQGIEMYQIVVIHYPEMKLNRSPAVPWITIVAPIDNTDNQSHSTTSQFWADIALVEIIRNAEETDTVRKAFSHLWAGHRNSQNIGVALRLLLQRQDLDQETIPFAQEYLQEKTANPSLQNDVRDAVAGKTMQPNDMRSGTKQ